VRIVFLDIDGVLNHEAFYRKRQEEGIHIYPTYPLSEFDPESVSRLNYILEQTGAKVVMSSSWRHGRTIQELQNILEKVGFKGELIDKTPSFKHDDCVRGNEIEKWIDDHRELLGADKFRYCEYVILDDDCDMLYTQKDNFIHVDRYVGITMQTAIRAINILKTVREPLILS